MQHTSNLRTFCSPCNLVISFYPTIWVRFSCVELPLLWHILHHKGVLHLNFRSQGHLKEMDKWMENYLCPSKANVHIAEDMRPGCWQMRAVDKRNHTMIPWINEGGKKVFIQDQIGWNLLKCWNSEHVSVCGMTIFKTEKSSPLEWLWSTTSQIKICIRTQNHCYTLSALSLLLCLRHISNTGTYHPTTLFLKKRTRYWEKVLKRAGNYELKTLQWNSLKNAKWKEKGVNNHLSNMDYPDQLLKLCMEMS